MRLVSKKIFLNTLECPTRGWLMRNSELVQQREQTHTLEEQFRIDQGIDVGAKARTLYPGGLLIPGRNMASAAEQTQAILRQSDTGVLFEGAFLSDGFATRADILERDGGQWRLIEVKSSVRDSGEFIDDMAYTAMVIASCGYELSQISLFLVSRDFRLGMSNQGLFKRIDHTEDVKEGIRKFQLLQQYVNEITGARSKPKPEPRFECGRCSLFDDCLGKGISNPIFDIPRLSRSAFEKLKEADIMRIEDIPADFPLTDNQSRVREAVQKNDVLVFRDALGPALDSITWPAYYLDFETVMTAIPLYAGIAPYTQIPTQYSIHKCAGIDALGEHVEYLADPAKDCRRELAERLLIDLEQDGSIVVYHASFEKGVIRYLAGLFPDLAPDLEALLLRILDLKQVIQKGLYHPDFHGSMSIKKTLPALVPGMAYNELAIADGASAVAAFANLALGNCGGREPESIRRDLLEYCKQDTLAMVRIHRRLVGFV